MFLGLCTCEYRLLHNPLTQNVWLQILGSLIKRLCTGNLLFPYNNQTISTQWLLTFLDFFVCHKVIYLSDLKQGLKLDEINVELNGLCRICRIRQKYLSCIVEDLLSSLNISPIIPSILCDLKNTSRKSNLQNIQALKTSYLRCFEEAE